MLPPASPPGLALVADDFTGALDASAPFATAGKQTALLLDGSPPAGCDVIAISTATRDLSAADAAAAVRRLAGRLAAETYPAGWYKKIDSALRGQPGAEIAALAEIIGATRVLVAPALPSEGRVVRDGQVFVAGRPLAETGLGGGHATSTIAERLGAAGGLPVERISLATVRGAAGDLRSLLAAGPSALLVADGETEEDLELLALAAKETRVRLCCGSAGLARHLAGPGIGRSPIACVEPSARPALIVAGSRHEATARQLAHAVEHVGLRIIRPPRLDREPAADEVRSVAAAIRAALLAGSAVALTTIGAARSPLASTTIAAILGRIAGSPGVVEAAGALLLTGGDVAAAVCRAIGCTRIDVLGEAALNIPLGLAVRAGSSPLPIVTKAGSFGADDVITRCVRLITR